MENFLMYGLACDEEHHQKVLRNTQLPYSVAHYIFEKKLIQELECSCNISHMYIYQMKKDGIFQEPTKKKVTNNTMTTYVSYINLPFLKFVTMFVYTFFYTFFYLIKNKNAFVLSTINYFPIALANMLATRILNRKNLIVFTDCRVGNAYNTIKFRALRDIYVKLIEMLENSYDQYILFSKQMNEVVNKKNRPYCVMEGFINLDGLDLRATKKNDEFTVIYAGSLMRNLGLENLVTAFKTKNMGAKLVIYGDGILKKHLESLAIGCTTIEFKGFLQRSELFEELKKANIVINTRNHNEPYTKYSFPSKTFEYLLSKTPFLTTKLECYPAEYHPHLFFMKDNSIESIYNSIQLIKSKSISELLDFGENAYGFVLNRKNPTIQTKKILDMIGCTNEN